MLTRASSNTPIEAAIEDDEVDHDLQAEHVIVGVDIGYTCTGVAISSLNQTPNEPIKPFPIQQWPGSDAPGRKTINKVPTLITYKAGDLRAGSWGFACPSPRQLSPGMIVKGLFKFLLDPSYLEKVNEGRRDDEQESIENVKKWFTDFLTKLYDHIVWHLESPVWNVVCGVTKVEYHFSLPTSWESNGALADDFRKIVEDSGFGSCENSSVTIGMTEAAASAVYTAKALNSNFKEGDVVLVCDAGGGTTDLCLLEVTKIDRLTVEMKTKEELSIFVGSVQIDDEFEALFKEKLEKVNDLKDRESLEDLALEDDTEEATPSEQFEARKLGWGTRKSLPITRFSLPGISAKLRVEFSRYVWPVALHEAPSEIESAEIDTMFDNQISQITSEIDTMLGNYQKMQPGINVASLVLAGGLGSSAYVQAKLRTRYEHQGMKILVEENPKEPPLSVCRGLVLDRMQRIMYGTSILHTRRCRASYGIAFREIYSKAEHKGRECVKDPIDGKKYVEGYIRWLIKKGGIVEEDFEPAIPHVRVASFNNPATTWEIAVVTSKYNPNYLPKYSDQGDCREVCKISSTSQPNNLTVKRKYFAVGKKFLYGQYEVKGSVEQENLKFETRVNGELVGSSQIIGVPWEYSEKSSTEP